RRRSRRRIRPATGCAALRAWSLEPAYPRMIPGIIGPLPFRDTHMTTITNEQTDAKVVEGSDGLLLEIDGQIVPNYDATMASFEEGEVVTGRVVRIDNDEVLVDIGYKSEG